MNEYYAIFNRYKEWLEAKAGWGSVNGASPAMWWFQRAIFDQALDKLREIEKRESMRAREMNRASEELEKQKAEVAQMAAEIVLRELKNDKRSSEG